MDNRNRWFNMNDPYAYRADNLRKLGFKNYATYLRSDLWQGIRARVFARPPENACDKCQKRPATYVHHRAYDLKTLSGEDLNSLNKLCRWCRYLAEPRNNKGWSRYDRLKSAGEYMLRPRRQPRNR